MNRIFKTNFLFYLKTLVIYGVLIALLHCPSMQNEHKYDERSVDSVVQNLGGVVTEVGVGAASSQESQNPSVSKSVYPYARLMNLIEQCRSIESEFRVDTVDFATHQEERRGLVKALYEKSEKVVQKLKEEKSRFAQHVAGSGQSREHHGVRYYCSKGRCRYSVENDAAFYSDRAALSQRKRRKKATRYTTQVLSEYIDRMEFVSDRLKLLLERVKRDDEAAKARSEHKAREMMGISE